MGLVGLSLRWVFSSDQCCFDMRSERDGMLRDCEVGIVAVESEEQKGLELCLFLVKIETFQCRKLPWKSFDLGFIEIF